LKPERIIIIGAGRLGCSCLESCLQHSLPVSCLESERQPFSPLASFSRKRGVEYREAFERDPLTDYFLGINQPTLVVSAFNNYIFPVRVLENPALNVINFHNALLPRHRGRNAATWSIFEQDAVTGITWHQVKPKVDTGDIIVENQISIEEDMTALDLSLKTIEVAALSFSKILPLLLAGSYSVRPVSWKNGASYHRSTDVPNGGWLDLNWSLDKAYAWLRSLDYGKFKVLSGPRLRILGQEFNITAYQIRRHPAEAQPGIFVEFTGSTFILRSSAAELWMACESSEPDSKHEQTN
jgi:methionyl-tRNA formyltransferase